MLYVGSNDAIKKEFEDSVRNCFDVQFLGPAKWFLQMRIHQHKDKSYTLDQHCYVLNPLQRYNLNLEFPECETPFPPDYSFSKITDQSLIMTSTSLKNDTNTFPSAPL
jgi:hypothetical protein